MIGLFCFSVCCPVVPCLQSGMCRISVVYQPFSKGRNFLLNSPLSIVRECCFFSPFIAGSFHVPRSMTWDKLESLVMVCSLSLCFKKYWWDILGGGCYSCLCFHCSINQMIMSLATLGITKTKTNVAICTFIVTANFEVVWCNALLWLCNFFRLKRKAIKILSVGSKRSELFFQAPFGAHINIIVSSKSFKYKYLVSWSSV